MIYAVLAITYDNVIGCQNRLPWHYPLDLERYNKITHNKKVLMGLNTYLSLKNTYKIKKFLYEKMYVVSKEKVNFAGENGETVTNLQDFLTKFPPTEDIFIIGGKTIYEQTSSYINSYIITYILQNHDGDIKLNLDLNNFSLTSFRNEYPLIFTKYQRQKK